MSLDQYKVLCVAGYHKAEEQFGLDVIKNFNEQFPRKPNVFFYNVRDNRGSISGKVCKKVDKEIEAQINSSKLDLIVEIHRALEFPDSISGLLDDSKKIKLEPGQVLWEICIGNLIQYPSDYVWYCMYVGELQKDCAFIRRGGEINPRSYPNLGVTWISIEAYLCSLKFSPFDKASYNIEVGKIATHIKDIIDSYRLFRHRISKSRKFQSAVERLVDDYTKEFKEDMRILKEGKSISWEDVKRDLKI